MTGTSRPVSSGSVGIEGPPGDAQGVEHHQRRGAREGGHRHPHGPASTATTMARTGSTVTRLPVRQARADRGVPDDGGDAELSGGHGGVRHEAAVGGHEGPGVHEHRVPRRTGGRGDDDVAGLEHGGTRPPGRRRRAPGRCS